MPLTIRQYVFKIYCELNRDELITIPAPSLYAAIKDLWSWKGKSPIDILAVKSVLKPTSPEPKWKVISAAQLNLTRAWFYFNMWSGRL